MSVDNPVITSPKHGVIEFTPSPNPCSTEGVISLQATPAFGSLTFNRLKQKHYTLWRTDLCLKEDVTLRLHAPERLPAGFVYSLNSDIRYTLADHLRGETKKKHYTFCTLPSATCEFSLIKGEHAIFGIQFTRRYLERWLTAFPLLDAFLDIMKEQPVPLKLTTDDPAVTPAMMDIIMDLHNCTYTGTLRKLYTKARVADLFRLSFERIMEHYCHNTGAVDANTRIVMQQVRAHLLQHYAQPGTLEEMARHFGMSYRKLTGDFRSVYETSIYDALTEIRMTKAKQFITEGRLSLKEIATAVGYNGLDVFSRVFKKYHGFPPSELK